MFPKLPGRCRAGRSQPNSTVSTTGPTAASELTSLQEPPAGRCAVQTPERGRPRTPCQPEHCCLRRPSQSALALESPEELSLPF